MIIRREVWEESDTDAEIELLSSDFPRIFKLIPEDYFTLLRRLGVSLLELDNFPEVFRIWSPGEIRDEFEGFYSLEEEMRSGITPDNDTFELQRLVIADDEGGGFRYCYKLDNPGAGLYYTSAGSYPLEEERIADNLLVFLGLDDNPQ